MLSLSWLQVILSHQSWHLCLQISSVELSLNSLHRCLLVRRMLFEDVSETHLLDEKGSVHSSSHKAQILDNQASELSHLVNNS